jgi:N-carbamoylputrescine amidase
MPRRLTVAALQPRLGASASDNVAHVVGMAERAAEAGARLILPPELFETPYFPKTVDPALRDLARPVEDHPLIARFQAFAERWAAVVPVSFYERAGDRLYNSVAVIDADGAMLGVYRKCHIPDFEGYREAAYFDPSPDGPKVWRTKLCALGVGICWDQWFPELARSMALMGAELRAYPTAIGSEPLYPDWDTETQWRRAMLGHAATNLVPVLAANRTGREAEGDAALTFYGGSFCADHLADVVARAPRNEEAILTATLDLAAAEEAREIWGVFQTRRPELYRPVVDAPVGAPQVARANAP